MTTLTEAQRRALEKLGKQPGFPTVEVFAPGPEYKALRKKGFVQSAFIGMRWWKFRITPAGRKALAEVLDAAA
jgi:hypothetical protein